MATERGGRAATSSRRRGGSPRQLRSSRPSEYVRQTVATEPRVVRRRRRRIVGDAIEMDPFKKGVDDQLHVQMRCNEAVFAPRRR